MGIMLIPIALVGAAMYLIGDALDDYQDPYVHLDGDDIDGDLYGCCETCAYFHRDYEDNELTCKNRRSEYYLDCVFFSDFCEEWERRDGNR